MNKSWIVISFEHSCSGDEGLTFWRPNSRGYTVFLSAAGRYTKQEAESICKEANFSEIEEIAIHMSDAEKLAEQTSNNGEHIALTQEQLEGMHKTDLVQCLWPLPRTTS